MAYSSLFKFQFMISEKVTFDYLCLTFFLSFFLSFSLLSFLRFCFLFLSFFFYKGRIKSRHMKMQRKTRYTSIISISLCFFLSYRFLQNRDKD